MRVTVDRRMGHRGVTVEKRGHPLLKGAGLTMAGIGAGALTEYLLDPDRGKARRARMRDKTTHAAHEVNGGFGDLSRDMSNRSRGAAMAARYRFTGRSADDTVLHDRVRAELGRYVSHPHAVQVRVNDKNVTLIGDVLADEEKSACQAIKRIPGVKRVDAQWKIHEEPGDVPTLQGKRRAREPQPELLQQHWSPTARALTGVGAVAAWPLSSKLPGPARWAVRGASSILATRAATNRPILHRTNHKPTQDTPD